MLGLSQAGDYNASVELYLNDELISNPSASFKVNASSIITGSVSVSPTVVLAGDIVQAGYAVQSMGNTVMNGLVVELLIVDPDTQTVMASHADTIELGINATKSGGFSFPTRGYALKTYIVSLQYVYGGDTKTLATASVAVKSGALPVVTIITPVSGSYYDKDVRIAATATDNTSGVDRVEYQIDSRGWTSLPIENPTAGRYATTWSPTNADEGTHAVSFRATNKAGNTSRPVSINFTMDLTPPALNVSTLSDGSWTNNELLNISGKVTDNTGIQQLTVNSDVVATNPDGTFSYPTNLQDGANTISVTATDLAENRAADTRTINLDRSAPLITIVTPADNIITRQPAISVTGAVDEKSSVTVKVNEAHPLPALMNGNNFSLTVTPDYGINTIEGTATDLAGNTSTSKRTVTFDDQIPSLAVTDPAQDVKTKDAQMILKGEVEDLTAITVMITMDGDIFTPAVTNGEFEQLLTFTAEKIYQIYVKAVDGGGNESKVQRNVVYDITGPAVTLNPATSPTNLNSQTLTGTIEAGAAISVTCPTATVGTVTYPTATTWTALLSQMQEGDNAITITATDEAGNTSSPVTTTIVLSTQNAITNTGPAKLWLGLKNSDDQGTQFDLRTELYINGVRVSVGDTLCITGVTRNPSYAAAVTVLFNAVSSGAYVSGDILSLKVLTRIGTNPNGQKCSGPGGSHNNAVGLRLYYDGPDRPSRFDAEIVPGPVKDLYLHSSSGKYFLDNVPPAGALKYQDSGSVNYNDGNPWKEIGTWTMVLQ